MKVIKTNIPEVLIIEPNVYEDSRGFFLESYSYKRYKDAGINEIFVQDNHSRSIKNTLRGLHYQLKHPQGKLVRVTQGLVFDVAVDIRSDSRTFGEAVFTELSDQNSRQLYVPPGFAHGFCVISDFADFAYKCTEYYNPNDEAGIIWNDTDIGILWPIKDPLISDKDSRYHNLSDITPEMLPSISKTNSK